MAGSFTSIRPVHDGKSTSWRTLTGSAGVLVLVACGGGGGGGDGGGGTPPVAGNPPTVTVDARAMDEVGSNFTLTATATDPDGDGISYSWRQDSGPAVSNTSGFDSATASFTAPDEVDTLRFTVTATAGGQSDSAAVRVVLVENMATAIFVDGSFTGTSTGSIDSPYSSLRTAIETSIDANINSDFYIKSLPNDEAYSLWKNINDVRSLGPQSFYGGYDSNWERDPVGNRTRVESVHKGLELRGVDLPTVVSGLSLTVSGPVIDFHRFTVVGITARGGSSSLHIQNNRVDVLGPDNPSANKGAEVFGLWLYDLGEAYVVDNVIETGDGTLGTDGDSSISPGRNGLDGEGAGGAFDTNGAAGGAQTGVGWNGGNGGDGGRSSFVPGESGKNGSGRSTPIVVAGGRGGTPGVYNTSVQSEGPGGDGGDGADGPRGNSGLGGIGRDIFVVTTGRNAGLGQNGAGGYAGGGGGGGGGGSGASAGRNGGGGGGGGEGGDGGDPGEGGQAGGASVGVVFESIATGLIARNNITSGNGGLGGLAGSGSAGGQGGSGGDGAPGNFGSDAHGGDGGDGGDGGAGGYGGGGAGGPSYGIWVGASTGPVVEENTIVTGRGGDGAPPRLSNEAASAGGGGWAYGIIDADVSDGVSPDVRNNTITPGTGGANGHPSANPPGDSGDVRLQ